MGVTYAKALTDGTVQCAWIWLYLRGGWGSLRFQQPSTGLMEPARLRPARRGHAVQESTDSMFLCRSGNRSTSAGSAGMLHPSVQFLESSTCDGVLFGDNLAFRAVFMVVEESCQGV